MSLIGEASGGGFAGFNHGAQLGGGLGQAGGGTGWGRRFAGIGQFQFACQDGATREAEGAEDTGQLVRGRLRGFALPGRQRAIGNGLGSRFENGHSLPDLWQKAAPEPVDRAGESRVCVRAGL